MMFQVTLGVICFSLFIAVRSLTVSGKEEWALEVKSSTTIEYVNALAEKHMFTNYGKVQIDVCRLLVSIVTFYGISSG